MAKYVNKGRRQSVELVEVERQRSGTVNPERRTEHREQ